MEVDASMVWAFLITIYVIGWFIVGRLVGRASMPHTSEDDLIEYAPSILMAIFGGMVWPIWTPFYGVAAWLRHKNLERGEQEKRERKLREAAQDH